MVRRGTRSRIALVASTVGVIAGTLAVAASAADRVYWGGYGASTPRISFANLDGSGGGDLNSGLATVDEPFGIAIDLARGRILWANDGGTLGALQDLTYTDPVFKRAADVAKSAKNLLVTAGDFMPADMQKAFWQSLLNVTRNPGSLDSELKRLDQVQAAAYTTS